MLLAPHRRTLRTSLILTAIVLLASGPTFAVDDDDWVLAAARPGIAKSLELTPAQNPAIGATVAEYQSVIYGASRSYPRGGQDADGTRQQARIQTRIETARGNALKTVRDALSLEQQAKLAELVKLDVPSREVTFRVGYFTSLLQPPAIQPFGKDGILLTRGQSSKVRAWVLQAEEDLSLIHI